MNKLSLIATGALLVFGVMPPGSAQIGLPTLPENAPPTSEFAPVSDEQALQFALEWAKYGKEPDTTKLIDTAITAMTIAYPPAGAALGAAKGVMAMMGFFNTPDLVGEAIRLLNERLIVLDGRMTRLENEVGAIRNELFRAGNRARMRELLNRADEIKKLTFRLGLKPTDPKEKSALAYEAQLLAARFLQTSEPDRDLWAWSDLRVRTDPSTHKLTGEMLPPDFKPLPALDYYVSALVLWIAAVEYNANGNRSLAMQTYGPELMKHVAYLRERVEGFRDTVDDARSLPELIEARVACGTGPTSRYPTNQVCNTATYCSDSMSQHYNILVRTGDYTVPAANARNLCTLPVNASYAPADEQTIEMAYGLDAMTVLSAKLERLATTGTTAEPYVGTFDYRYYAHQYLYAVKPNGELLEYDHLITEDRNPNPPAAPASRISDSVKARATGASPYGAAVKESATATINRHGAIANANVTPYALEKNTRSGIKSSAAAIAAGLAVMPPGPKITHAMGVPQRVGTGWQSFTSVIPAGLSSIYGLTPQGVLKWYRHDGFQDGSIKWKGPVDVGTGWNSFAKIIAGGDGVLYGLGADGSLRWYRHGDVADTASKPTWSGPTVVGSGWQSFVQVISTGEGVIYAVAPDGKLMWYRHKTYLTGERDWEGPKQVGTGWQNFKRIFSPGEGVIYALTQNGELLWYKNLGYKDGTASWQGPVRVAANWNEFTVVFPRMWGTPQPAVVR